MYRFCFELALEFKEIDIEKILSLPLPVINKWRAFFSLQPFGFSRDEYFAAKICATIVNMSGKSVDSDVEIEDLMAHKIAMQDIAKPGKRTQDKVRSIMSKFK